MPHSDSWYTFIRQPHAKSNNDAKAPDYDSIAYSEGSRSPIPEEEKLISDGLLKLTFQMY